MLAASAAALCLVSCGSDTSAPAASGEAENAVIEAIMNRRSIRKYKYGDRNEMRIYYKDVDSFKWLSER